MTTTTEITPEQFDRAVAHLNQIPTSIVTPTGQITFGRTSQILEEFAERIATDQTNNH